MNKSFLTIMFAVIISFTVLYSNIALAHEENAHLTVFEDLAEKLVPTVVNISTVTSIDVNKQFGGLRVPDFRNMPKGGNPFEEFFKQFDDQNEDDDGNSPVEKEKVTSLGSGFVIDAEKGYIVTNSHVVRDADEVTVILNDNINIKAEIIGKDDKTDIALLKVKTKNKLVAAKFGDSDKLRVGSWVLAIGNPFGFGGTVTAGIVSARHRDINSGPYDEYIQTDASINKGNSGGPMFNTAGEVVGVNTAIFSPMGGSVGIGFAVPANIVKKVIDQLIKYGKTKRGWLGVNIQEVSPEIAESMGLKEAVGAIVAGVNPEGPSAKAGVKSGDIILEFDGKKIDKMRELPKLVADTKVGKKVNLVLLRKGKKRKVTVVLGQLEKAEEDGLIASSKPSEKTKIETFNVDEIGISAATLNKQMRLKYNIAEDIKGVVVTNVKHNGEAFEKGLAEGDVIIEVNQKEVISPKHIVSEIKKAKKDKKSSVLLFISRGNDKRFVALKLKK